MRNEIGQFIEGPRPEVVGANNPAWRGGRSSNGRGYIRIRVGRRYFYEHRLVMEQHLGRNLLPGEQVHHINHDRSDNRIENLELTTIDEHTRKHNPKQRVFVLCCTCGVPIERAPCNVTANPVCSRECNTDAFRRRRIWEARWGRK